MITRPLNLLLFLCVTTFMLVAPAMADDDKKEDEPKKYEDVITDDAETDEGMFKVHRLDGKLFFEIPENLFGRDMLLVSRIAKVPAELAGGFMAAGHKTGEQVLRWEMVDEKVLVRKVSFERVADENTAIHKSVVNNNFFPILASFEIQVEGPKMKGSKTQVIDVTDFYQEDVPAISGLSQSIRKRYKVKSLDKNRSFLNYARAYPENVDVRSTLTFKADEPPVESNTETISLEMHQSMVLLPEEPMRRRYADRRVGWFTYEEVNFGLDKQKAATQEFLSRWRLEPKDEKAYARGELVEPKKQIVYYLDPGTPEKWAPYVKQGVEDWNVAFETAGFKNAIVAKEAPKDEEWTGEDVRYSVVRWAATEYRNAMGPSVADPRSGEIIESDIVWYHNHMKTYRNRLMLETGASNPLARSLPIDDELLGDALRQVIAHEIGHAIGLPHNMIASSAYPVASLRDPGFCREMGVSPSIMDYTRQNYIAQPGDGLVGSDYIRQIGPYDHYSVNWGYRWIPDKTPIEEKPILDSWILEKADDPMYRFSPQRGGLPVDPRAQTEDMGDDPVLASTMGVQNLKKVAPQLPAWTAKDGEDYGDLTELYNDMVGMFARYVGHVVTNIGGMYENLKASDQEGWVYEPVPAVKQRESMEFLRREVLTSPTWLNDPETLRRIEHAGAVDRVRRFQERVVGWLLNPGRMQRLIETEAIHGRGAYTLINFMDDLKEGIFGSLGSSRAVDTYGRNLQRVYLERLEYLMQNDPATPGRSNFRWHDPVDISQSDIRAVVRGQLRDLQEETLSAAEITTDRMTQMHYTDISERIQALLDNNSGE